MYVFTGANYNKFCCIGIFSISPAYFLMCVLLFIASSCRCSCRAIPEIAILHVFSFVYDCLNLCCDFFVSVSHFTLPFLSLFYFLNMFGRFNRLPFGLNQLLFFYLTNCFFAVCFVAFFVFLLNCKSFVIIFCCFSPSVFPTKLCEVFTGLNVNDVFFHFTLPFLSFFLYLLYHQII